MHAVVFSSEVVVYLEEAAASVRACDSAGSVASFPSLGRKWEEGGTAPPRVQL